MTTYDTSTQAILNLTPPEEEEDEVIKASPSEVQGKIILLLSFFINVTIYLL